MGKRSPTYRDFNPTQDERVDWIKSSIDGLIAYVREQTEASGPETKRRASIAITGLEQASMWAVKALFSEDAVGGDDGGAEGPDRTVAKELSDARDLEPP